MPIYIDEIRKAGLYDTIWQAFAVLLPVKTVGVMGDGRTYDYVVGLRAVTSTDGMTADFYPFDMKFLGDAATRIINEVKGVNRVVYDVTQQAAGDDRVGSEARVYPTRPSRRASGSRTGFLHDELDPAPMSLQATPPMKLSRPLPLYRGAWLGGGRHRTDDAGLHYLGTAKRRRSRRRRCRLGIVSCGAAPAGISVAARSR